MLASFESISYTVVLDRLQRVKDMYISSIYRDLLLMTPESPGGRYVRDFAFPSQYAR